MSLKRIFKNPFFYAAVAIEVFSMFYPHFDARVNIAYFPSADFLYFMMMPLTFGLSKLFLPLMASMPGAIFLAQDRESRADRLMNHRLGRKRFAITYMAYAAAGAVLAVLIGFLIYALFVGIFSPLNENIQESWRTTASTAFTPLINKFYGIPFVALNCLCLIMTSAVWSLVAACIACFSTNIGVVIGGTFLLHYGLCYFCTYVVHSIMWNPMVLQSPTHYVNISVSTLLLHLLCYLSGGIIIAAACLNMRFSLMKK